MIITKMTIDTNKLTREERAYIYGMFQGTSMASVLITQGRRASNEELIELIVGAGQIAGLSKPTETDAALIAKMMVYVLPSIIDRIMSNAMKIAEGKGN